MKWRDYQHGRQQVSGTSVTVRQRQTSVGQISGWCNWRRKSPQKTGVCLPRCNVTTWRNKTNWATHPDACVVILWYFKFHIQQGTDWTAGLVGGVTGQCTVRYGLNCWLGCCYRTDVPYGTDWTAGLVGGVTGQMYRTVRTELLAWLVVTGQMYRTVRTELLAWVVVLPDRCTVR